MDEKNSAKADRPQPFFLSIVYYFDHSLSFAAIFFIDWTRSLVELTADSHLVFPIPHLRLD
jgi:hypothetical protein